MTHDYHTPVLVNDVLNNLQAQREGIYVDGTLGGGGHAESILRVSSPNSKLVCFDVDEEAIRYSKLRLNHFGDRVLFVHDNYANIQKRLQENMVEFVDGILLDLGVSSFQIDTKVRGFSFQNESRIDMRMSKNQQSDGWTVVNTYSVEQLSRIFWDYGEEKYAKSIAKKIAAMREQHPLETTRQLSSIVETAVGRRFLQKSLARVFQAIRIEVNDELDSLRKGLQKAIECLKVGGRIVVISYHSLEDRIVKGCFLKESSSTIRSTNKLIPDTPCQPTLELLTKKPIVAGEDEINTNPRARSAKLRAAVKVAI